MTNDHTGRPLALPVCCVLHRYGLHGVGWLWFGMADRCPLRGVAAVAGVAVAGCSMQVQNKEDLRLSESPVLFSLHLLQLQSLHLLHLSPVLIRHLGVQAIELLRALGDEHSAVMIFQNREDFGTCRAP